MNEAGPISLRASVIDRCQLRCLYCRPEEGVELVDHRQIISYEEIVRLVEFLKINYSLEKVRITGGDPLVRRGIEDLVRMLKDMSVPDIAMTTNAQLLSDKAELLRSAGLDRINISFDSLDPETFSRLTRGGSLEKTLEGIDAAVECGLSPVKLNMVVIKGINDAEVTGMLEFAMEKGLILRYLELMPVGSAMEDFADGFVSSEETREAISGRFSLEPLEYEEGSTVRRYSVDGGSGEVGFISPYTESFCGGCRRLRLTSDGHLVGCLSRGRKVPVREMLSDGSSCEELAGSVEEAVGYKSTHPDFPENRSMVSIGG